LVTSVAEVDVVPFGGKEKAARCRIDSLTSLRFFAAVYVVLFHTETAVLIRHHAAKPWITFAGHGYLAVSFFFILSGFLLTWTYADRRYAGSFKPFLLARFARIYPVYLLALLIQRFNCRSTCQKPTCCPRSRCCSWCSRGPSCHPVSPMRGITLRGLSQWNGFFI
jgi:hypothetical protein